LKPLDDEACGPVERAFCDLTSLARTRLAASGFASSDLAFERALDLRYVGQQWSLQVPVKEWDVAAIRADFEFRHQRQFGHDQPTGQIEIVQLRLVGIARLARTKSADLLLAGGAPIPRERRAVYLDMRSGFQMLPVYDGNLLRAGHRLDGPALIEESNTTILIGIADRLEIDADDNFLIHVAVARGALQ
jgi:N-methylhydantoinase A